jgi:hypothetical protein
VVLYSIGSMSDTYPAGFYPASSTVPAQWTDAPGQPGVVQFNGLVYEKSNRHIGGTGKPNEEEVGGIRTWKLYTPAGQSAQIGKSYRFYWAHLHSCIEFNASSGALVYDEDVYSSTSNYFLLGNGSFAGTASQNLYPGSGISTDYRLISPTIYAEYPTQPASGLFDRWHQNYIPPPSLSAFPGVNGYPSPDPNTSPPTPYTPPSPMPPVEKVVNKYIYAGTTVSVGKTYTGYVQKFEATGSWVFDGTNYIYTLGAVSVTQVAITHTVTQQDFIDYVEGTVALPLPTQTFTATGGEDYWVGWGDVILTDVSPTAND